MTDGDPQADVCLMSHIIKIPQKLRYGGVHAKMRSCGSSVAVSEHLFSQGQGDHDSASLPCESVDLLLNDSIFCNAQSVENLSQPVHVPTLSTQGCLVWCTPVNANPSTNLFQNRVV